MELEIIHVSPGLSALFPMNSDPEIEFFVGQLQKFVFVSASVTNHTINILISFLCFFLGRLRNYVFVFNKPRDSLCLE